MTTIKTNRQLALDLVQVALAPVWAAPTSTETLKARSTLMEAEARLRHADCLWLCVGETEQGEDASLFVEAPNALIACAHWMTWRAHMGFQALVRPRVFCVPNPDGTSGHFPWAMSDQSTSKPCITETLFMGESA